jgi:hypothetical protein
MSHYTVKRLVNNQSKTMKIVRAFMIKLLKCDKRFRECWNSINNEDQKEILEQLEEEAYDWITRLRISFRNGD